jgi:hypothetical protein
MQDVIWDFKEQMCCKEEEEKNQKRHNEVLAALNSLMDTLKEFLPNRDMNCP